MLSRGLALVISASSRLHAQQKRRARDCSQAAVRARNTRKTRRKSSEIRRILERGELVSSRLSRGLALVISASSRLRAQRKRRARDCSRAAARARNTQKTQRKTSESTEEKVLICAALHAHRRAHPWFLPKKRYIYMYHTIFFLAAGNKLALLVKG